MTQLEHLLYGYGTGPLLVIPKVRIEAEARRAAEIAAGEERARRQLPLLLAACWGWNLLGAVCFGWAAHIDDGFLGDTWMLTGFALGYGGSLFTVIAYYVRRAERGE
ncbi:MAG TPA: hypothetical protein VF037_01215 [Gemmatimonadales bacterium]